jgi:hypothetical protein
MRSGVSWVTSALLPQPWMAKGSFGRFLITHDTDPGSGKTFTYTLVVNGSNSALSATIDHTNYATGASFSGAVQVNEGDTVMWTRTSSGSPTAPTRIHSSIEFNGAVTKESSYGINGNTLSNSATVRNPLFSAATWTTANVANRFSLVSAAGDVTGYRIDLSAAPGAAASGKKYDFAVYKNGTKQDGSGGTVDTRGTILETATTVSVSFTLAVSGGDQLLIECVPTSTPTTSNAALGTKFVSTTDGYSQLCEGYSNTISETATKYLYTYDPDTAPDATEGNADNIGGLTNAFTVRDVYQKWVALGAPTTSIVTVRKNGASGGVTCTVSSPATTCSDTTNTVSIAPGDTWSLERNLTSGGLKLGFASATQVTDSDWTDVGPTSRVRVTSFGW